MKFRLALGGLICLGLMSGSAFAITAGTTAPAPTADVQEDPAATDANAAPTDADQNPYSAIIKANVFQLKEPPPPPKRDDPAILNLPKVNITGFHRREGQPMRALFATVPKDPKESPNYFNLAEGEKDGILELKRIDPAQEFVEVIIAGTPTTLTVKSNSFVQPIVIPKPGAPGAPGVIAARPPQPMAPPMATPTPAYNNNPGGGVVVAGGSGNTGNAGTTVTTIGGNIQPNFPGGGFNNGVAPGNPGGVAPSGDSALRSIPTRGIRTPNYTPGTYQPQTLQEAQVHAAVYNAMNEQNIQAGELPPGPPPPP
jgi:hypothetical protein